MKIHAKVVLLLAIAFFSAEARAGIAPVAISIFPPVQFPRTNFTIIGARVSALWGRHWKVYGADFGVIGNITDQKFVGFAVSGIFNATSGTTTVFPLQLAGVANIDSGRVSVVGLQLALGLNYLPNESTITGLQVALINASSYTDIRGLQVGLYNAARRVYGFQIGVINTAESLHGIQIGLINFHRTGFFSVAPVINIGF